MSADVLEILERIAENGHAPEEGCSRFGVGFDKAFDDLKRVYLDKAFGRGRSSEKFVVGPFGSGKSHFLRQLMEIARSIDCATAEVPLNKDIDFTQSLLVYQEVVREIRAPGQQTRGMHRLLEACLEKVRSKGPDDLEAASKLVERWVKGLGNTDFKEPRFARVAKNAFEARLAGEVDRFEAFCRWLSGDVADRALAKEIGAAPLSKAELNRFGLCAFLSTCQLVHHAGFRGTVICFDECEQGFSVGKKQFHRILSMLQSGINAAADLRNGSALVVYAITPDIAEGMEGFPALQQRVADPGPQQGFFDGNPRAPKIDLSRRGDPFEELREIGLRLVDLLYEGFGDDLQVPKETTQARISEMARDVADSDAAVSNRRTLAKRAASALVNLQETGSLEFTEDAAAVGPEEPEV